MKWRVILAWRKWREKRMALQECLAYRKSTMLRDAKVHFLRPLGYRWWLFNEAAAMRRAEAFFKREAS